MEINTLDAKVQDEVVTAQKIFWAGSKPPLFWFEKSEQIFDANLDYRMPKDFHQSFDVVYLTERDLASLKAWPLIVDEALRLLKPNGVLVLRMTNTPLLSIFELKNFLCNWSEKLEIGFEHTHAQQQIIFSIKNTGKAKRKVQSPNFTFGLITNGAKPDNVRKFIDSIAAMKLSKHEHEILLCGPESLKKLLTKKDTSVKWVEEPAEFQKQGWITKKKNIIASRAKYENLVITHDRYYFPPNFVSNIRAFGLDFDVLVCRQTTPDGARVPDWVTIGSSWSWSSPAVMEYGDWSRNTYINGGIMIAKTAVLKKTGWCDLLFWNQAEDVELTRRLFANGCVPRLARDVVAVTAPTRAGFFEGFHSIPLDWGRHWLPGPNHADAEYKFPNIPFDECIPVSGMTKSTLASKGIYLNSAWDDASLSLKPLSEGECVFQLPHLPSQSVVIELDQPSSTLDNVLVNGLSTKLELIDNRLQMVLDKSYFKFSTVVRIRFPQQKEVFSVKSLEVSESLSTTAFGTKDSVIRFKSGWSGKEGGVFWGLAEESVLEIHYLRKLEKHLMLNLKGLFVSNESMQKKTFSVFVNDIPIGTYCFNRVEQENECKVFIHHDMLPSNMDEPLLVKIKQYDLVSPLQLGLSNDCRPLGIGVTYVEVSEILEDPANIIDALNLNPMGESTEQMQGKVPFSYLHYGKEFWLGQGWHAMENWGVWSAEPSASLYFNCSGIESDVYIQLQLESVAEYENRVQEVEFYVNDTYYGNVLWNEHTVESKKIIIPRTALPLDDDSLELELRIKLLWSPNEVEISNDERILGIAIKHIDFGVNSVRRSQPLQPSHIKKVVKSLVYGNTATLGLDARVLFSGWSQPEEWGVWALGNCSILEFYIDNVTDTLSLSGTLCSLKEHAQQEVVNVFLEGNALGNVVLSQEVSHFSFKVDSKLLTSRRVRVTFWSRFAQSPKDRGINDDERQISFGLVGFSYVQNPSISNLIGAQPLQKIDFSQDSHSQIYLRSGWSYLEPWGVWGTEPCCVLSIPVNSILEDLWIEMTLALLFGPQSQDQQINIMVNGFLAYQFSTKETSEQIGFAIPIQWQNARDLCIEFYANALISPKSLGLSDDDRTISLGLRHIELNHTRLNMGHVAKKVKRKVSAKLREWI